MSRIFALTMPKWGIEMQEGTVSAWQAETGAAVEKDQELLDIETEKIVNTLESPAAGVLRRQLAAVGDTVPVGALVGVIAAADVPDGEIDAFVAAFVPAEVSFEPAGDESDSAATVTAAAHGPAVTRQPAAAGDTSSEVRISPVARRLAQRLGLDVSGMRGSGRNGRISKQDVEEAAAAQAAAASTAPGTGIQRIPMSALRKSIARRLVASKREIPHFYLRIEVDAGALQTRRAAMNADREAARRISINDFFVRAVALALGEVPEANVQVQGEDILRMPGADIALAVATDDGLLAPLLRGVESLPVETLSLRIRDLAQRARERRLTAVELEGGGFSVSNLGMHGIRSFDAVINPPQAAILALGAVEQRCVVRGGAPAVAWMLTATLSCDHRAIDGVTGARFLQAFRRHVEDPSAL